MNYYYKLLLTVLFYSIVTPTLLAQTFSGGSGTTMDPYQINTVANLLELDNNKTYWGYHYQLTADIDMSRQIFHPIGIKQADNDSSATFTGSFDGNFHTIDNLTITKHPDQETLGVGFIGYGQNCTVKNLGITNISINVKSDNTSRVGGIIGVMEQNTTVQEGFINGAVNVDIVSTKLFLQGSPNSTNAVIYLDDISMTEYDVTLTADLGEDLITTKDQSITLTPTLNSSNEFIYNWNAPEVLTLTSTNQKTMNITCSETLTEAKTYTVQFTATRGDQYASDEINITVYPNGNIYTFTGAIDNNWENKDNWDIDGLGIPTNYPGEISGHESSAIIVIPEGKSIIISNYNTILAYSTYVSSNASITIDGNGNDVKIMGDFILNEGNLIYTEEKLIIKGNVSIGENAIFSNNFTLEFNGNTTQRVNINRAIHSIAFTGTGNVELEANLAIEGNWPNFSNNTL